MSKPKLYEQVIYRNRHYEVIGKKLGRRFLLKRNNSTAQLMSASEYTTAFSWNIWRSKDINDLPNNTESDIS